jgi:signal transduction histidine kinase
MVLAPIARVTWAKMRRSIREDRHPLARPAHEDVRRHPTTSSLTALTVTLCVTVSVGAAFTPGIHFAYHQPGLHIAIETAAALVASLAAFLVAGRFSRSGRLNDLLLAAALAILALNNLVLGAIPAAAVVRPLGASWGWLQLDGNAIGAALFALAALVPGAQVRRQRLAARAMSVAIVALGLAALVVGSSNLLGAIPVIPTVGGPPKVTGNAITLIMYSTMLAFAIAGIGLYRRSVATNDAMLGFFAAGATALTFARLDFFLYPSLDAGWVYVADLLRLLAYMLMAAGAAYEIVGYWRSQSEAAVLEERRRIARDLHDGLAQELAYITRVSRQRTATESSMSIQTAAERALAESRRAIAALTRPLDEPLDVALAQAAEETAARCDQIPMLQLDLPQDVVLDRELHEALIRVTCEAVSNAARHGQAKTIEVMLRTDHGIALQVSDDGTGFDMAEAASAAGRFGITSMRERVEALGGSFNITSQLGAGTRVEVTL